MASARCRHFLLVRLWQPLRLFFLIRFYSLKNYLIISNIIYTKFFTYFNYKTFHLNWSACMTKLSRIFFYFNKSNLRPAEWILFKQGHTFAAQRESSFFFFWRSMSSRKHSNYFIIFHLSNRFLGNAGYGTLIWVVTAEILPPKVRSIANSIIICFAFLCGFIISKTFVDLLESIQRSGTIGEN